VEQQQEAIRNVFSGFSLPRCLIFFSILLSVLSMLFLLQYYAVDLNMSAILWMLSPSLARYFSTSYIFDLSEFHDWFILIVINQALEKKKKKRD